MLHFFLECTIRAALIVGATVIVLYVMRVKVASVKHRVWTTVLLLMLALPLWIAWGPKAPIRILPANVENFAADVFVTTPATAVSNVPKSETQKANVVSPEPIFSTTEALLLGLYLLGALIFLARLAIGTSKARRLIRESLPCMVPYANAQSVGLGSGGEPANSNMLSSRIPGEVGRSEGSVFAFLGGRSFNSDSQPMHISGVLTPVEQKFAIRSSLACAAPVTVGYFCPTILLPENCHEWPASQLAAVLAHEREHARRRDPLIQWLALFNRAIFWFHPAAWWLERELSALAEECCDAAVLAQGHDPSAYAETLMHMARAIMHAGSRISATGTTMPGPRLLHRIRKIIDAAPIVRVSSARAASLIAVSVTVCAAFFAATMSRAQSPDTLAWEKAAGGKMSFEAASVKQDAAEPDGQNTYSNVGLDSQGFFTPTGGLFRSGSHPLTIYIAFAYKLTRDQVHDLSSRLPKWVSTQRWDIDARAAGNPTKDQYRLMVQSLLAARFRMAVHFETQQRPVLALKLQNSSKLGPRLQPHRADVPCATAPSGGWPVPTVAEGFPKPCGSVMWGPAATHGQFYMGARDVGMAMIANALSFQPGAAVDRTVVDETGLTGNFDFTLRFSPPVALETRSGDIYEPDPEGASFIGALKEQLGLRLISTTAPVSEIVIDHIEEPTPN